MDYKAIQEYYDTQQVSWKTVAKHFEINPNTLWRACKNNLLQTRTRSESIILDRKKNPRKHSQETKDKLSKQKKEYLLQNPDKVPYKLNHRHKKESYPETYFKQCFKNAFIYQYRISLYELDFAHLSNRWDIEIDGNQHLYDLRIIEHDQKRNTFLTNLGWTVIRIIWATFVPLPFVEKEQIIQSLLVNKIPQHDCLKIFEGDKNVSEKQFILSTNSIRICPNCKNKKDAAAKMCCKCHSLINRTFARPEKQVLEELIINNTMQQIGTRFKVSDKTVSKWLKYYNITLPYKKGHHFKYYLDQAKQMVSPVDTASTPLTR